MTNQKTNGEKELATQEAWDEFSKKIKEYLNSLNLIKVNYFTNEAEVALSFDKTAMKSLTSEECLEYAYSLDRYSMGLQKEYNHHNVHLKWAKHNMDVVLGKILDKYGNKYSKYEEKRIIAISDNVYCKALNTMILEASARMDSIDFLASKVSIISKHLVDLSYLKRKLNG